METWADNHVEFEGKVVRLRIGHVYLDNGELGYREVVEHAGGVCVIPYTGDSVVLIRQFRIACNQYLIEAPAGKIEGDEDPEIRGSLELEEETGYKAGRLISAGKIFPTVGFCSEIIHLYLAFDLVKTQQNLETEEQIEVIEMSLDEVEQSLREHRFIDGKTALGLHRLLMYLAEENSDLKV